MIFYGVPIDDNHLFVIPDDCDTVQETSFNFIIPCRPTLPDINVKLLRNNVDVSNIICRFAFFTVKYVYCLKRLNSTIQD